MCSDLLERRLDPERSVYGSWITSGCRLLAANILNHFLEEVFVRSVILFQPDFCFMKKDLRFRLTSLVGQYQKIQ